MLQEGKNKHSSGLLSAVKALTSSAASLLARTRNIGQRFQRRQRLEFHMKYR